MSMTKKECRECGNEFEFEVKRGRPPVKCGPCRELPRTGKRASTVAEKLSPVEIVDKLEFALRANGTHISQHRNKWE